MRQIFASVIFLVFAFSAHSAILVEDNGKSSKSYIKLADDGLEFRDLRKVGVGLGVAGIHGLFGLDFHLNFTKTVTFTTGFGLSKGFQEFHLQLKKVIAGKSFLPYITGGLGHWYSTGNKSITSTSPSFLAKRFLSKSELKSGNFRETLVYPGFGIEYLNLKGDYAGTGFYLELLLLVDLDDFLSETSAGFGMNYYF